jgi:hypothetical protein
LYRRIFAKRSPRKRPHNNQLDQQGVEQSIFTLNPGPNPMMA